MEAGRLQEQTANTGRSSCLLSWLVQTIQIVQPLVILCLGGPAASAIIHAVSGSCRSVVTGLSHVSPDTRWRRFIRHTFCGRRVRAYEAGRRTVVGDIAAARLKVIEAKREPKLTLF